MKRGFILIALVLLVSTFAWTATTSATGFQANFVETRTLPGFNTPLITHGEVQFNAEGLRWETTSPYHYLFEMHGKQAWEQLPDGRTRQLDPAQVPWLAAIKQLLSSAFGGNQTELKKYFQVSVTPLANGRRVLLTPKPGALAQAIARIEVTESAPGHPEQLVIHETSGGRLEIRFKPSAP